MNVYKPSSYHVYAGCFSAILWGQAEALIDVCCCDIAFIVR